MADPAQTESPVVLNSNGPAVIRWTSDGKAQYLGLQPSAKVHFHLHFDATSRTAFFRLRLAITLESLLDTPTPLFIFVYPERIESLTELDYDTPNELLNHLFRGRQAPGSQLHLRFKLSRPADLVLPKTVPSKTFHDAAVRAHAVSENSTGEQTVHGNASANVAYLLMLLARASAFDVHAHPVTAKEGTPANAIPTICEATSSHLLNSNTASSDLVSLYGGKGGQVFEFPDIGSDAPNYTESPPAYNEVAPTVPTTVEAGSAGECGVFLLVRFRLNRARLIFILRHIRGI